MEYHLNLPKIILLSGLAIAFLIYLGINSGFLIQEADAAGAEFCTKSCQKRLAAQKNQTITEEPRKPEPCYGIYCSKESKEKPVESSTSTTKSTTTTPTKTVKTSSESKCYGIYCNREDTKTVSQTEAYQNFLRERNFISIKIGKACTLSGTCPTIKEIADLYDNSDKYLSGDFYFDNETNQWKREKPAIPNAFEFYKFTELPWVVFVDPDDYTWDRSKQIIIESNLVYRDTNNNLDETRTLVDYVGLKMDGCRSATIGWQNNGSEILLDVLNHFYDKCRTQLEYDPLVETFLTSTIFPDCDQECFEHKQAFKTQLRAEGLISNELWEKSNCNNTVKGLDDRTAYERNKNECDRVRLVIGIATEDNKPKCYGIYCEDKKITTTKVDKSFVELKNEKLIELEQIKICKDTQNFDDSKINGVYRRTLYDCNDKTERNTYVEIRKCLDYNDFNINCDNEKDRKKYLSTKETIPQQQNTTETVPVTDPAILECEKYKAYELQIETRKKRAELVTCEDQDERLEYMQEMKVRYPKGI